MIYNIYNIIIYKLYIYIYMHVSTYYTYTYVHICWHTWHKFSSCFVARRELDGAISRQETPNVNFFPGSSSDSEDGVRLFRSLAFTLKAKNDRKPNGVVKCLVSSCWSIVPNDKFSNKMQQMNFPKFSKAMVSGVIHLPSNHIWTLPLGRWRSCGDSRYQPLLVGGFPSINIYQRWFIAIDQWSLQTLVTVIHTHMYNI